MICNSRLTSAEDEEWSPTLVGIGMMTNACLALKVHLHLCVASTAQLLFCSTFGDSLLECFAGRSAKLGELW